MNSCNILLKIIWWILLTTEITATITQGPSNTVAELGSQVTLDCEADAPIEYWVLSENKNGGFLYVVGSGCSTINDPNYATESLGNGTTCNLIVLNVTLKNAGVYECYDGQNSLASLLTVIDPAPLLAANTSFGVVANESVEILCDYTYNGSLAPAPILRPYIYWTDINGENVASYRNVTNDYYFLSALAITAGRRDIMPYTARVYLELDPPFTNGYATNTPSVNLSVTSEIIEVFYPPGNVSVESTVSTTDNCVYKPESLTCTADANPPAIYYWTDLSNNDTTDGALIAIASGGQYQCTASNIIRGQEYIDTQTVTETSCHPATAVNITISGSSCTDDSCSCVGNQPTAITCSCVEYQPTTITCVAFGFPEPTYQWWYNNNYFGSDQTIQVLHDGVYGCAASNTYAGNLSSSNIFVNLSNCEDPCYLSTGPTTAYTAYSVSSAVGSVTDDPCTTISTRVETTVAVETTTDENNTATLSNFLSSMYTLFSVFTPEINVSTVETTTSIIPSATTAETTAAETTAETTTETTAGPTTETAAGPTIETTTGPTTDTTTGPTNIPPAPSLSILPSSGTTNSITETTAPQNDLTTTTRTIVETTAAIEITSETTNTTTTTEPTTTTTITSSLSTSFTTTTTTTTTPRPGPCNPNPCRNGASCVETGTNTFSCICVPGFTSQNCAIEINECEANPCYPFGECTDLIGDYNCTCNPGYKSLPNNTKMCNETNFCANATDPCYNGGTCVSQNALNRFYCICAVLGDKQYVGLRCETELITKPIVNGGISPTSGIIAGGANVTIRGQGLNLFEPLGAYLIDTTSNHMPSLYAYVFPNLTFSDSITVRVPPAENTYVDKNLLMIVEYSGPINITSEAENLRFRFTGNPVIKAIEPSQILVTGGVHVTVSGSNMDTVQNPVMDITTFVTNATTGYSEQETNYSRTICSLKNSSAITCLVPYGIVPASFFDSPDLAGKGFVGAFHLGSSFYGHKKGRRTKRAPISTLTDKYGRLFEMYLGIIFDALKTFSNLSKSLDRPSIGFRSNEVDIKSSGAKDFVTNKMKYISIYGGSLSSGSMQDYTVLISEASCNVTSLTDNELECEPPKKEPPRNNSAQRCESNSDRHPVMVYISGKSFLGACVSYTTDYKDLIIAITVPCVVFIVIVILVVVLICKRHKKNQEKDVTILTYLEKKLFQRGGRPKPSKPYEIYVNHEAPQELLDEALHYSVKRKNNDRPTDFHHPTTVEGQLTRPADDSGYLVVYDDDEASKLHNRGWTNVAMNTGKKTTAVEIALSDMRSDSATVYDNYLKPSDDQLVRNDDMDDIRGDTYDVHYDESGSWSASEPDPDYLILNDTQMN